MKVRWKMEEVLRAAEDRAGELRAAIGQALAALGFVDEGVDPHGNLILLSESGRVWRWRLSSLLRKAGVEAGKLPEVWGETIAVLRGLEYASYRGEDIPVMYRMFERFPGLRSCMTGAKSERAEMYARNPEAVRLVAAWREGIPVARTLVWRTVGGEERYDRVYHSCVASAKKLTEWLEGQGVRRVGVRDVVRVSVEGVRKYPYMDTLIYAGLRSDGTALLSGSADRVSEGAERVVWLTHEGGGYYTMHKCPSCGEWSHAWNTRLGVCLDCIRFCAICYTPVVSSESVVVDGVRYCRQCYAGQE